MTTLYAPAEYWTASPEKKKEVCNGCGPFGKFDFVPDNILSLDISEACDIHDWMYTFGATIEDKAEADRVFLNNILRLIEGDTSRLGRWLKPFRRRRALLYYEMVTAFGGPAYWKDKNSDDTEKVA